MVEGVPAQGTGVELGDLQGPFQPKSICDPMNLKPVRIHFANNHTRPGELQCCVTFALSGTGTDQLPPKGEETPY